jgi:hypothetical protein
MKLAGRILVVAVALLAVTGTARAVVVRTRTAVAYRPRPVARAAVVTTAAVATTAVVGAAVRTLPPSCSAVAVGGVAYQHCGNAWYQPRYAGSEVSYVVVTPPQ